MVFIIRFQTRLIEADYISWEERNTLVCTMVQSKQFRKKFIWKEIRCFVCKKPIRMEEYFKTFLSDITLNILLLSSFMSVTNIGFYLKGFKATWKLSINWISVNVQISRWIPCWSCSITSPPTLSLMFLLMSPIFSVWSFKLA